MPPRSKIDGLPELLREKLQKKLLANGFSEYTDLAEWLEEQGYKISKSSIHRFGKDFEDRMGALRLVSEQARVIVEESPDEDGAVNDALIRLVQEKAFKVIMEMEVDPDKIKLDKLMKVIADLSRASVSQKKLAAEIRRETQQEYSKKLDDAVEQGKLDPKAAEAARREMGFV